MIKNYLKTGFRHLLRNKLDTFINVGGLALGASIAILIGLWVHSELTFNQNHRNQDRIAQVYKWTAQKWLPYKLAIELKENYSESFKHIVTAMPPRSNKNILSAGEKLFGATGQYVEAEFAELFTLDMIEGGWKGLKDPHSILLAESTAKALFGDKPAIDQLLKIDNTTDVKVTGVYRDLPRDSEFHDIQYFTPWSLLLINEPWIPDYGWDNHFVFVYVELQPGVTFEDVAPQIAHSEINIIRHLDYMKANADEAIQRGLTVWLQPMSNWHLHSTFDPSTGTFSNGPIQFVYMVAAIGIFVVVLACINFMNLATARSERRMREVGVRKAIGSLRSQLIAQFFSESLVVVFLALIVALVITQLSLPAFNELSAKQLSIPWATPGFWLSCVGLMGGIAILAGSYPALYLSSFRPSIVLKGQIRSGQATSFFRRILLTIQFTVSIMLIVSTIVVYKQIMFAKDREVGYSRGGLLIIPAKSYRDKFDVIKHELLNTGVVAEVAGAGGMVTSAWSQGGGFDWVGETEASNNTFGTLDIMANFGKTVGWKIAAGRDFDENIASDSNAFVINESAAKAMGFIDPVGQVVHWKSKWHGNVDKDFRIIGVVKNLVMRSPYDNTMPAVFYLRNFLNAIHVRIADGANTSDALVKIGSLMKNISPDVPFEYHFADEEFDKKFAFEEQVGKLATVFATLAIIISCLGLFGMASFITQRRTKEIGIRKVVGATVFRIWKMMSAEFVVIVMVSFLIAAPLSWYAMSRWIERFVYRTDVSWEVFAVAGIGSLVVTMLTVSFQLVKAASQSPVRSLKSD